MLVGVSILSFLLLDLAPGDYLDEMRLNPRISPETVVALRARYGLERGISVRYVRWLASVARGEWGYSFAYHMPVAQLLWPRAVNTLLLTATGTLITCLLAVPAGIWWAQSQSSGWNRLWAIGTSTVLAVPQVLLGLLLLLVAVTTRAFPVGGMWSADLAEGGPLANRRGFDVAHDPARTHSRPPGRACGATAFPRWLEDEFCTLVYRHPVGKHPAESLYHPA